MLAFDTDPEEPDSSLVDRLVERRPMVEPLETALLRDDEGAVDWELSMPVEADPIKVEGIEVDRVDAVVLVEGAIVVL